MRFLDLFAGIGGFSLGLERTGMTCVGHMEIDPFCRKVLRKHWPEVPLIADVKEVQGDEFGAVELICGGPPCQPVSLAGKRQGQGDDRWLWGEALRLVEVIRPPWCLFENPPGIVSLGLDRILADLEGFGYSTGTFEIPACAVDAPHIRQRVWIVAESVGHGRREVRARQLAASGQKSLSHAQGRESHSPAERRLHAQPAYGGDLGDTPESRFPRAGESRPAAEAWNETRLPKSQRRSGVNNGWRDYEWIECTDGKARRVKPGVRLLAHGVPRRVARLRALGNAVVPQVVERIGQVMMEVEKR